jgi:hypothetical protein
MFGNLNHADYLKPFKGVAQDKIVVQLTVFDHLNLYGTNKNACRTGIHASGR